MTPAAQICSAIEILGEILNSSRPADSIISNYFRTRRYIGSKDRKFIQERIYRIMRHYHRLCWHLKQIDGRNLVIADMCMVRHEKPEDFFGAKNNKYAPAELSTTEKEMIKFLKKQRLHHKNMPENISLECPSWAYSGLKQSLGEEKFTEIMQAMLSPASLDLRTNTLKTSRDELQKLLKKENIDTIKTKYSPWGLRVVGNRRPAIGHLDIFKKGLFEVQDEGSQLVALICGASKNSKIFDFCSGAGGKSLALAAVMENKGAIIATDISEGRLKRSKERFKRAGVHNVTTKLLKSENDKWLKRHFGRYDIVLVDAPCSGSGTWRRNPDKKWRNIGADFKSLLKTQENILNKARKLLKKGGRLIYATCSLLDVENSEQFEKFIKNNPDMQAIDIREINICKNLQIKEKYLKLNPYEHKTDGFFCAIAKLK